MELTEDRKKEIDEILKISYERSKHEKGVPLDQFFEERRNRLYSKNSINSDISDV
ncbi:MAG: hypothetical protein ACI4JZ_10140 [Oscillospiraceae bacterium]